jgi:hypothetical protein
MSKFLLAAIGFGLALAPAAAADPFKVSVDQTVAVKLAAPANSILIGNATVADVTVHDANTILITGKAFGTTNLVVLDRGGKEIWSNTLAVISNDDSDLTIVRAGATNTYSCFDKCRPTPMVGDSPEYFSQVMSTVTGKASAAKGGQ